MIEITFTINSAPEVFACWFIPWRGIFSIFIWLVPEIPPDGETLFLNILIEDKSLFLIVFHPQELSTRTANWIMPHRMKIIEIVLNMFFFPSKLLHMILPLSNIDMKSTNMLKETKIRKMKPIFGYHFKDICKYIEGFHCLRRVAIVISICSTSIIHTNSNLNLLTTQAKLSPFSSALKMVSTKVSKTTAIMRNKLESWRVKAYCP